jgi:hypothetical protein
VDGEKPGRGKADHGRLMSAPRVEVDHYSIRVYFGDALHIHIRRSVYLGFQSWSDGPHDFSIEFALDGGSLLTEYDNAESWRSILRALDGALGD